MEAIVPQERWNLTYLSTNYAYTGNCRGLDGGHD